MTEEEGGRHKPFVSNYRPQFFIRTADVTGTITLPEGQNMIGWILLFLLLILLLPFLFLFSSLLSFISFC